MVRTCKFELDLVLCTGLHATHGYTSTFIELKFQLVKLNIKCILSAVQERPVVDG